MADKMKIMPEKLYSLGDFKAVGKGLAVGMSQPYLLSTNIVNLKYINEYYGYQKGDALIEAMAEYFCEENPDCVAGTKSYIDHMFLLCEGHYKNEKELVKQCEKLCEGFQERMNKDFQMSKIHIDCGVYPLPPDEDFNVSQDNVEYARRSIGASLFNTIALYKEKLRERSLEKAAVVPAFDHALANGEILVLLQPKYSVKSRKIIGAEALSRFPDSEGNLISPAFFVPILEEAQLVPLLDFEVLRQIVDVQAKWMKEGRELFPISVNLSRMDFTEDGMIDMIDDMISDAGIPKSCIEFELTETVVMENLERIIEILTRLREDGYRIAMDDFGSGYNSLYVLGQIPADVIKFDRGFVLHSIKNDAGMKIMRSLVDTFKDIDFEVLCEGVETKEEEERIVSCGCDVIQGYLCDRPITIKEFEEKYQEHGLDSMTA